MNRADLIHACFRKPEHELPVPDLHLQLGAADDVLAHVGVYWRSVKVGGASVPVAGIGLVCTDPEWTRRGLASGLLDTAHELARRRGLHFAALFSSYGSFYERHAYIGTSVEHFRVAPLVGWSNGAPRLDWDGVIDTGGEW